MAEINVSKQSQGAFDIALRDAEAGDEIVYHIGPYADGHHKRDALRAALDGRCFIFQRKISDEMFSYIAVKASEKHTKRVKGK
jgi:hypothetical protein